MNITRDFAKALKISFMVALVLFAYSFMLSYYGMHGFSISRPEKNTILRIILNNSDIVLSTISFWLLVGYICKDYKTAILALLVSLALKFGIDTLYPKAYIEIPSKDFKYYILSISGVLPYIVFGFAHFKNSKGVKLVVYWMIIWGLVISLNTSSFERMIEGFTRIFGLRDLFDIHVPTGESSYREISVLHLLSSELFFVVKLSVFWWVYHLIKSGQSIWNGMNTIYYSVADDRFSYSIIYWSFRIMLFVAGLGIVSYIANSFRVPIDIVTLIRVTMCTVALIITASIYRNFLVSHFIQQNRYPGGLYFMLNIPIVNIFAWVFSLFSFNNRTGQYSASEASHIFESQKLNFQKSQRNSGLKLLIIALALMTMLYQLNRAGLRVDGPSRDGAFVLLLISVVTLSLLLWFLYNKDSFIPLLIISSVGLVLTAFLRIDSLLFPTIATGMVNLILFYGLFYFDKLKLEEPDLLSKPGVEISENTSGIS